MSLNMDSDEKRIQALCLQTLDAITKLHSSNTSNEERQRINHFLTQVFPNDKNSWAVLHRFLKQSKLPHEAHFFAANMLRKKLCKHFNQLNNNSHGKMTDSILEFLIHFKNNSDKNIRIQLEIALAYIFIQRPDWSDAIQHLVQRLATPDNACLLLETMTLLAEEVFDWKIPLSDKFRKAARQNLEKHAGNVLLMLDKFFQNAGQRIEWQYAVFKCFHAWLFVMDNVNTQLLGTSKLSSYLFLALKKEELFNVAASGICKLLRLQVNPNEIEDEQSTHELHREVWQKSFSFIVPKVLETLPAFKTELKKGTNIDKIESFSKIYVDTAEVYLEWIIENSDTRARQLLGALLEVTKFKKNPRIPMYAILFWDRFLDPFLIEIKRMNLNGTEDFGTDFVRNWEDWAKWFVENVIPQLALAMVSNCEWPEHWEDQSQDNLDLIHSHRWQCSDILAKIAKILSARRLLEEFYKLLVPLVKNREPSSKVHVQIEAILFCIRSNYKVYENPTECEHHPLKEIFRIIPELKDNHYRTRSTAIALIARHVNFLDYRNETFDKCMHFVCQGLSDARVSSDAAHCIKSVCEEFCAEEAFVQKNWPILFQLYEKSFHLSINDGCDITRGLVEIIRYLENYEKAQHWLKLILDTPVKYLDGMVKNKVTEMVIDKEKTISLLDVLKRISVIWKYCEFSSKFPMYNKDGTKLVPLLVFFFQKLWPYFKIILETHKDDDDLMEKTTRIVKHTIRNEPIAFAQCAENYLVDVLGTTMQLYQESPRSCFLYIVSVYVDEYGDEPAMENRLRDCLFKVSKRTLTLLSDKQKFNEFPEVVEDYFELIVSYMKRIPQLIIKEMWLLEKIFIRGLDGLLLQHRKALEAICQFYKYSIILGRSHERRSSRHKDKDNKKREKTSDSKTSNQNNTSTSMGQKERQRYVMKLLRDHGRALVFQVMKGLMYEVMLPSVHNLEQILEEFYQFDKHMLNDYMKCCLEKNSELNLPTEDPTPREFLDAYFRSEHHSDRQRCVFDLWRAAERYLLRTKY